MAYKNIHDPVDFGRVAVLMGGMAAEREVSLNSGAAVLKALQRQQVNAIGVDVGSNFLTEFQAQNFDRVFNIIHGRGGEDGILQAGLELLNMPYTGSGVLASALSMDKLRTKWCWRGLGLPTPKWVLLTDEASLTECVQKLEFPVIVKPAQEGSSFGMSKAHNYSELVTAFELASQYDCAVYAEQWVIGSEYTVAILQGKALPMIRLQFANEFYDYEAKYKSDTTKYFCPCGLVSETELHLQQLALQAADAVGVTGWGRVDMFLDHAGRGQLIEVNTVPGMTDHSLVPMAAQQVGIDFDALVWKILETSI